MMLILFSCSNKEDKTNVHYKGEVTLQYDDSFVNVAEALSYRYTNAYPETKINLKVSKEDEALTDLLNKKVDIIIMSRELTDKEKEYWERNTQLPYRPSYFGADAVCFVVNKNSTMESISLEEIKQLLVSGDKKLVFEGGNTSNFNAVVNKLNLSPQKVDFSQIKGNENIIKEIEKLPNHIGVVSYNTISNPYGENQNKLKEKVKILPIKVNDSLILPNKENLKSQKYPFTKLLYFLTTEGKFGLANGFIRYSCTHIGQKIVGKEGLQPYYIFPRTINVTTEN